VDKVGNLLEKIEQRSIVPNLSLTEEEIEAALNQRDNPQFAETWMKAFHQIETMKRAKQDADPRIGRLREVAYLQAYERWRSADLAAYISDDFGLIGDALATDYNDSWMNGLLYAYLSLRFPQGNLAERAGRLGDDLG